MKQIKCKAYAKINLSIDVIGKREDGYHEVVMVLQQIDLHDTVTVRYFEQGPFGTVSITTDAEDLPLGEDNIAWKAAKLMQDHFPDYRGGDIHIKIEKRIPMAAGLGGGSADAAAVLHGLNALWGCSLSLEKLMEMGVKLGADVPFCIMGQAAMDPSYAAEKERVSTCALARGIGEILTPLTPLEAFVVLLKPEISVSTVEVYRSLDFSAIVRRPDTESLIRGLSEKDFNKVAAAMYNVLQEVSEKKYTLITHRIRFLQAVGSEAKVMMSGSGPTIFALAQDERQADNIFKRAREKYPGTYLVKTCF